MSQNPPTAEDRPAAWAIGLLILSVAGAIAAATLLGFEVGLL